MKELRSSVQHNEAHCFSTKLQSPTVTLPRIKVVLYSLNRYIQAIVSGIIPNFMDLIWNFASPKLLIDNWLKQAKNNGKKLFFNKYVQGALNLADFLFLA